MGVTIDVSGVPADAIRFAPSPLAELVAMLHVICEPGHHAELQGWSHATSAALPADLRERIMEEAGFLWRTARADFFAPGRPHATLAAELDDLDRVDDESFVGIALLTSCGSDPRLRRPSPLESAESRRRALDLAQSRGPRQAVLAERLIDDPAGTRAWIRTLLEDADEAFGRENWERVRPALAADARRKADLMARYGLGAVLAGVSPATSLEDGGTKIHIDKLQDQATTARGVGLTFIPTVFGRPHLFVVHAPGSRPVVQYPVAEPDAPAPVPVPMDVVRLRVDALSHPVRQRLARTMARGPHTTGQLADTWQMSAPEVSRHLAVLKKAGLVTVTRHGRYVRYQLDLVTCARLGADFLEAILR